MTYNKAQLILIRSTFYTEVMRHYSWLGLMQSLIMDYNTLTRILLRVWTTGCYGNLKPKNSWQDLTISILDSKGNYSATSNNMKLVHWPLMGWAVTFGTARRGLGGLRPRSLPPRCTKCNSPPINGQCTNHQSPYCYMMVRGSAVLMRRLNG